VLGSGNGALVLLLSKSFLTMLGLAILIGLPLSYFINEFWLNLIAYRTNISAGMIGVSVMILLFFGVVTVGSQTLRATFIKPVDNLKNE
jgi:putative ABC transport system permease protein